MPLIWDIVGNYIADEPFGAGMKLTVFVSINRHKVKINLVDSKRVHATLLDSIENEWISKGRASVLKSLAK